MRTPQLLRAALTKANLPGTIHTLTLPGGKEVTVCLLLTETPPGDIHETRTIPDPVETAATFRALHTWASMVPAS